MCHEKHRCVIWSLFVSYVVSRVWRVEVLFIAEMYSTQLHDRSGQSIRTYLFMIAPGSANLRDSLNFLFLLLAYTRFG